MPLFTRSAGSWVQGNNPSSKPLFVRDAGVWKSAANIWVNPVGSWVKLTDYVGTPGAPTSLAITSSATNFSTMSFSWVAPTSGAPVDHYHFVFYHQDGSFWADTTTAATTLTWGWAADQYYQMEVFAVTAAGVESSASNRVRYKTGHPQQTRLDPNYNWGSAYDVDTATVYASTTAVIGGTTYHGSYATDGSLSTSWYGGSRSLSSYFDAIRVNVPSGGYRRVYSVRCRSPLQLRMWLGMAQDLGTGGGWYYPAGGDYPTNASFWFDATARSYFQHGYLMWTPEWAANTDYDFVIDNVNPAYIFSTDRCTIDVACDLLKPVLSGTRAGLTEVTVRVQDWTIVSYTTVVTVAQVNNAYW